MGVSTSEVGYTSATTRRETTKFMMDMWWHWKTTNNNKSNSSIKESSKLKEYKIRKVVFCKYRTIKSNTKKKILALYLSKYSIQSKSLTASCHF
jgi:hypothetical protein